MRRVGLGVSAAIALAGIGAIGAAPSQAASRLFFEVKVPVTRVGETPETGQIGRMRLQGFIPTRGAPVVRATVRGSVRLPAGDWCLTTSLLPQTSKIIQRDSFVSLESPAAVLVPRLTRTPIGRATASGAPTELARVTIRRQGCLGSVFARGSFSLHPGDG